MFYQYGVQVVKVIPVPQLSKVCIWSKQNEVKKKFTHKKKFKKKEGKLSLMLELVLLYTGILLLLLKM